jgi:hypothetical protein
LSHARLWQHICVYFVGKIVADIFASIGYAVAKGGIVFGKEPARQGPLTLRPVEAMLDQLFESD